MSTLSTAKKKICIVTSSLGKGGAEKSSAVLSILLDNLGYEVHVISILNRIDYDYKGTLLNLGALKDKDASFFGTLIILTGLSLMIFSKVQDRCWGSILAIVEHSQTT